MQWKFLIQIFGTLIVGCTKLSILFLYRRIFTIAWFRTVANVFIAIIIGWTVAFTVALIFQCSPVSAFWSNYEFLILPYCMPALLKFYLGITVSDFITDVLIVILPIPVLWKLKLPLRTRIATVGIFLLGAL